MTKHALSLFFTLFAASSFGQTINWANDIAPILYQHCVQCHRDGGIGHFSLIGYGGAYTNRGAIVDATEAHRMPPWKPDPSYTRFAHENRLTEAQIQTIRLWVEADAPPGDMAKAPADPVFSTESTVGTPDQVLKTPLYTVTATDDEYRCFVIPNGLTETAYLRGLEAMPGNHEIVHHILIYEDVSGKARQMDAQTPEAGYVHFGGPGVSGARLVGTWVPGARTELLPPFMGVKLSPGADLIVQMHYPRGVTGMADQTTLNLFFTPSNQGIREVSMAPLLNHTFISLENYPLSIPANAVKTYHAKFKIPQTGSVVGLGPHMHLIGRNIVSFGITPQGDTLRLIRINDWDFHWQGGYTFPKVQKIPAGTTLHAYATYDNTLDNPHQPNNPPQAVEQGEATTDEMMLVYFAYMAYQPGDENIVLDSTLLTTGASTPPTAKELASFELAPNPLHGNLLQLELTVLETTDLQIAIYGLDGRLVKKVADKKELYPGIYRETADLEGVPGGVYFAQITTSSGGVKTVKFVKMSRE